MGDHKGKSVQIANYYDDSGKIIAAKLRVADKKFSFVGEAKKVRLYGQWLWHSGGKMITVCEGEIDALSISQAQGNRFAVVSVPNGAPAAAKAIRKGYDARPRQPAPGTAQARLRPVQPDAQSRRRHRHRLLRHSQ